MPPDARHERRIVVSTGIVSVYECRAAVAPSFRIRSKRPEPGAFRPISRCECARNRPRNESRIASRERCGEPLHESSIRKTSFADGNAGGLPKGVFRGMRTVARTVGGARLGRRRQCGKPGRKHRFTGVRQGFCRSDEGGGIRGQFAGNFQGFFRPTPLSGSPPSVRSSKARPSDPVRMKSQSVCEPQIGETGSNLLLHNSSACFSRSPLPTHPVPRRLPTCPAEPLSLRSSAGASARGAWPY